MEIDKLYEKITLISSLLILSNLTFIAFGFPLLILKVNLIFFFINLPIFLF